MKQILSDFVDFPSKMALANFKRSFLIWKVDYWRVRMRMHDI